MLDGWLQNTKATVAVDRPFNQRILLLARSRTSCLWDRMPSRVPSQETPAKDEKQSKRKKDGGAWDQDSNADLRNDPVQLGSAGTTC